MKPNDEKTRIIFTLPVWMYEEIKALAEFNRRKMSEEIRISIEDRLKDVKRPKSGQP